MSGSCRREIVLWRSKHISNQVSLLKLFRPFWAYPELPMKNDSPFRRKRLLPHFWEPSGWAVRKQRIARGERKKERKEGRKETVSRGKRPAAEGAETDAGADAQTYGHKKTLKYLYLRASVKTATTYSPTCAVPSAWRSLTSLFGMGRGGTFVQ